MDKLDKVELILPVGWGESFIHPDIEKIIRYLKDNKHKVKITSNGLLLNNPRLRSLALEVDYLTFSLELPENIDDEHGHGNKQILENITLLIKEKGTNKKPFLCLQSVLLKSNKKILDVIRLAKEVGVDRVNLVRPYMKFDKTIGLDWRDRKKIYEAAEALGKEAGIRVDMFEYASFTGLKRFLWKWFKWICRINSWCPRLYDFAYITIDGKVTPCCALPRYIVGDLNIQTMDEIWNGKAMKNFRRNHIKICRECDVFKVK